MSVLEANCKTYTFFGRELSSFQLCNCTRRPIWDDEDVL